MNLRQINWRVRAREFCREKQFFNVELIEAAMIKGAEIAVEASAEMISHATAELKSDHDPNRRF